MSIFKAYLLSLISILCFVRIESTCLVFPTSQLNSLYALYTSTNGVNWSWKTTGAKWNFTEINPNPCSELWQGITCNGCNVTALSLPKYNLIGSIPSNISGLIALTTLDLSQNSLVGSIPSNITQLSYLTSLLIYQNKLTGTLPSNIGQLSQLQHLKCLNNKLTGSLPVSLSELTHLIELTCSYNLLDGTIPNIFTDLINLQTLVLNSNKINGSLPDSITSLTNLFQLTLSNNYINGTIPSNITQLTKLVSLLIDNNQLTGSLPQDIGALKALSTFYLNDNHLTGYLPESMGNLSRLGTCYLLNNNLTGPIPPSMKQLSTLVEIDVSNNRLTGSLADDFFSHMKYIQKVNMGSNHLTGKFPTTINTLTKLRTLELNENGFIGPAPNLTYANHSLTTLDLSANHFTGPFPISYINCIFLSSLNLGSNALTGTIPLNIGVLTRLSTLVLGTNIFTGPIPNNITQLTNLLALDLSLNSLNGSIPENIGKLSNLYQLILNNNQLTGTIPSSLTSLTQAYVLILYSNKLHGSIPSDIGNLQALMAIYLYDNQLSGSIPSSLLTIDSLQFIELFENRLTGSIPASISNLLGLEVLMLNYNHLTGSIPASIANCSGLVEVEVGFNQLTGTVPQSILSTTFRLLIQNNHLTGQLIFPSLPQIFMLYDFVANDNYFTGNLNVLPLHKLAVVQVFQLQNNFLTGTIPDFPYAIYQPSMAAFDLSNNIITGTIPSSLFEFPNLGFLSLVKNCISGTIPTTVCNRHDTLKVLALDGLYTASACQSPIFGSPLNQYFKSYSSPSFDRGSIPTCLFTSMYALQTLHLSGNLFTGSLPSSSLSPSLVSLSLSHNLLTGTIPTSFYSHDFQSFDLSFNKLTGQFPSFVNTTNTTSYNLNQNRLSGTIPTSLETLPTIDILSGNMFQCDAQQSNLPTNDPHVDSYECGSTEVNDSISSYGSTLGFLLLVILFGYIWNQRNPVAIQESHEITSDQKKSIFYDCLDDWFLTYLSLSSMTIATQTNESLPKMLLTIQRLKRQLLLFLGGLCIVTVLVYSILGIYYSSYLHRYTWSWSIAYLTGSTPAIVLLVLLMTFLLYLVALMIVTNSSSNKSSEENNISTKKFSFFSFLCSYDVIYLLLFLIINFIVVIFVNSLFILLILSDITPTQTTFLSIAMSIFKVGWRNILFHFLESSFSQTLAMYFGKETLFSLFFLLLLFNTLIIPWLASIFINSNCFYYAFIQSSSVTTSFTVSECAQTNNQYDQSICMSYTTLTFPSSYEPPFTYNYLCSSSLLSTFASVWIYMFLFSGLVAPLFNYLAMIWLRYHSDSSLESKNGISLWFLKNLPLRLHSPQFILSQITNSKDEQALKNIAMNISPCRKLALIHLSTFAIVICFGVLFPPIAIAGCLCVIIQISFDQLIIMRLAKYYHLLPSLDSIETSDNKPKVILQSIISYISSDWEDSSSLLSLSHDSCSIHGHWLFISGVFWSFFLWDMMGDSIGAMSSLWILLLMISWSLFLLVVLYSYHYFILTSYSENINLKDNLEKQEHQDPEAALHSDETEQDNIELQPSITSLSVSEEVEENKPHSHRISSISSIESPLPRNTSSIKDSIVLNPLVNDI